MYKMCVINKMNSNLRGVLNGLQNKSVLNFYVLYSDCAYLHNRHFLFTTKSN